LNNCDIERTFNSRVGLDDSLLQLVELRTGGAECRLTFDFGRLLNVDASNIFDSEAVHRPACLTLFGVRSVSCEGASYQLNSTVVGYGARAVGAEGFFEFYFDLTGGTDPDAFMVKLVITARDFGFGPA
jgi:hypothetical protein